MLPATDSNGKGIMLSLFHNMVPLWRIRYLNVKDDVAFLQVVANSLMMKLQNSVYDKVENLKNGVDDVRFTKIKIF